MSFGRIFDSEAALGSEVALAPLAVEVAVQEATPAPVAVKIAAISRGDLTGSEDPSVKILVEAGAIGR